MGNYFAKNNNNYCNYNFNPLSTEITDYYDLDRFHGVFDNEIYKYNMLINFSDLQKDLEYFLLLKKNEGVLFYKTLLYTDSGIKIFVKIYFLQRINNKIRYASLHIYDVFYDNVNYFEYAKNVFVDKFNFLNIQFDQIELFSIH